MIVLILLFISFGFITLAFLLIIGATLKTKKKKGSGEESLPKLSKYGYGFGLLALITLVFVALFTLM